MKKNLDKLDSKFWSWFPRAIDNPKKINDFLQKRSDWLDKEIIQNFKDLNLQNDFGLFAIGGYGNKEIFPASDIDISIIQINQKIKNYENLEKFIANLWDYGHKVGHSVRNKKELKKIISEDVKEFTSFLSFRPLSANKEAIEIINKIVGDKNKFISPSKFFNKKKIEQEGRHASFDSTSFNLEPDLKESPGSLRDFQTGTWILNHCFNLATINKIKNADIFSKKEFTAIEKAHNFIKLLRYSCNLIQTSSRNRLSFNSQIELAKRAKIKSKRSTQSVEILMQKYFYHAEVLSIFNETIFDKYDEKGTFKIKKDYGDFFIRNNRIGFKDTNLQENKHLIFEIFIKIGQRKDLIGIDTKTARLLKENAQLIDENFKKNNNYSKQFLQILRSPYNLSSILRKMKRLGIMQAYIKEFGEVIGQMQFDLFHIYTVDEHTFKVVRNMRQMKINHIDDGFEIENELINRLPKIEILYIAGLFHDLGKGKGGDHSEIGAKASYKFAKKLGMSLHDAELISWLVLNHLEMSSISQRKDIYDPSTIKDFANKCKNLERLNYLYLLTINDIRATNPSIWNGWKHGLLRSLFFNTRSRLNKERDKSIKEVVKDRINSIVQDLGQGDKNIITNLWKEIDESYFGRFSSSQLKWQAESIIMNEEDADIIELRQNFNNLLEIFIKIKNVDGLFLNLVKIFGALGVEIIDADISTTKDKKIALNTFIASYKYQSIKLTQADTKSLSTKIKAIHSGSKKLNKIDVRSDSKNMHFKKPTKITDSIDKQKNRNIITIETTNSSGLLVKIAQIFKSYDVSIHSAKITTLGEKVEDTFFIEDQNINLISKNKIQKIKKALSEII